MLFRLFSILGYLGFFRHDWWEGPHPEWWPMARVYYPKALFPVHRYSEPMPIGDAWAFAKIYDGFVVPVMRNPDHRQDQVSSGPRLL